MRRWIRLVMAGGLSIAGLLSTLDVSEAQMGSRPFAFRNSSDGLGMSRAGRQAIINRKLLGVTPDVLLKGPDGGLLGVQRGPGRTAIITSPGGEILPDYRGRGRNGRLGAGIFNAYFLGNPGGSYPQYIETSATRVAIDSWTSSVIYGGYGEPPGGGNSSVDQWTGMVYFLNHR